MTKVINTDGLLEDDSKEFGLTYDEYQILLEDYERAIDEANRKYGYGGPGYLAEDGNYYVPNEADTPKYVDHIKIKQRLRPRRLRSKFKLDSKRKSKSRLRPMIHYTVRPRAKAKLNSREVKQ
jgi:hypothetical protein